MTKLDRLTPKLNRVMSYIESLSGRNGIDESERSKVEDDLADVYFDILGIKRVRANRKLQVVLSIAEQDLDTYLLEVEACVYLNSISVDELLDISKRVKKLDQAISGMIGKE